MEEAGSAQSLSQALEARLAVCAEEVVVGRARGFHGRLRTSFLPD